MFAQDEGIVEFNPEVWFSEAQPEFVDIWSPFYNSDTGMVEVPSYYNPDTGGINYKIFTAQTEITEAVAQSSGLTEILKSVLSSAISLAPALLKQASPSAQQAQTSAIQKLVQSKQSTSSAPSASLANIFSNPLLLGAIGVGVFLMIRGRKKRRR